MEPIQLLLCVGAERGSWVRVGPGQGIRAVPDSRSPVKQAAGLKKKRENFRFHYISFSGLEVLQFRLDLGATTGMGGRRGDP